ncbi:hypothetical protein NXF25_002813 [Crotalus adamanteus]|uniref:Uncharacterized protein n=1 Tax=Crotalus adamanteus TaxID=8729 RepID=A0AAW1CBC3_CROAD
MEEKEGSPEAKAAAPSPRRLPLPTEAAPRGRTQSDLSAFRTFRKSPLLRAPLSGSGRAEAGNGWVGFTGGCSFFVFVLRGIRGGLRNSWPSREGSKEFFRRSGFCSSHLLTLNFHSCRCFMGGGGVNKRLESHLSEMV